MARELLSPQARAAVFDPPIHLFFVNRSNAYIKAGLILGELTDPAREQLTLFEGGDDEKRLAVMQALDTVNRRWGRNTLFYAASGTEKRWSMRRERKSPSYTTRLDELLRVV